MQHCYFLMQFLSVHGRIVTWYLSVFGHGAEKARLNPSLMFFTGIVTPGRRLTNDEQHKPSVR
jgi:hypothetical protein